MQIDKRVNAESLSVVFYTPECIFNVIDGPCSAPCNTLYVVSHPTPPGYGGISAHSPGLLVAL